MRASASGIALAALLVAHAGGAEERVLDARLACAPANGPGRVFCQLDLSAGKGRLVWGDALVTQAPAFVRPLRSRVAARPDVNGAPALVVKLALVASEAGSGSLELDARAVVCQSVADRELCTPELEHVSAAIVVANQP
jgi:hypothetical protein